MPSKSAASEEQEPFRARREPPLLITMLRESQAQKRPAKAPPAIFAAPQKAVALHDELRGGLSSTASARCLSSHRQGCKCRRQSPSRKGHQQA
eukprot:1589181-Amphidinium_carterae.1